MIVFHKDDRLHRLIWPPQTGGRSHEDGMELRHLRYFVALAEQLNFTRAAELVHVTQSTLSHQIKQLETELGRNLFDRVGKRVVLTDAGERLLSRVTNAMREIEEGVRSVKGAGEPLIGSLRIGATHTFIQRLIPACVADFIGNNPSVSVRVMEMASNDVQAGVGCDELDLGIAYRPPEGCEIQFEPLYNDELCLLVSLDHPFAKRRRIHMIELHRQRLITPTNATTTRRLLDEWFRSVGAEPVTVVEVDPIAPILDLVRRMDVAGIVSRLALPLLDDLRAVPIENPTPMRIPGILWKEGGAHFEIARSFAATVRNAVVREAISPPS